MKIGDQVRPHLVCLCVEASRDRMGTASLHNPKTGLGSTVGQTRQPRTSGIKIDGTLYGTFFATTAGHPLAIPMATD